MLRVFRVLRILRLLKGAKGVRDLLMTLVLSFPALVNVFGLLALCLVIDLVGGSSFFLGEGSDVLWAPISALLVQTLWESPILAALNFLKELLPLTDVLPLASLAWLLAYAYPQSAATRALGLRRLESERLDEEPR